MGAGTSTEQVADKPNEEQVEQCVDLGQEEQDGQEVEVNTAGDAKLLHTNGKIAIINGAAAEGAMEAVNGCGMEEILLVKEVEQQEPSSVILDEEPVGNMGVAHNDTTTKETPKEDGQVQTPEATDTTPDSEEKAEPSDEANENQNNEVGFKKVFKFVGFKFTVKKDKNEKSEPVQLLTVKKDEVEVNGTDNHEEHSNTADDTQTEIPQETKDAELPAESPEKPVQAAEAPVETPEEIQKKVEECDVDKDQKSPVSPTNPVAIETSSPFRRFFTQGWAGLRKKTSFKKSREEDPQEVEKHIKIEEQEKAEVPETVKEESITEAQPSEDHSLPQELSKSPSEDSKESEENHQTVAEEKPKQEETSPDNEAEVKLEEVVKVDEVAPVAENTECAPEIVASAPEATILPEIKAKADTLENKVETQITDGITAISSPAAETISEDLQGTSESGAVDNDQPQLAASTECGELEISQEAITTEAELLSSQEKAKMQGSPLKKLFSSSGLRKLSGKKSKSKKDDDGKVEVMTEAVSSVSPEAPETDGGESSPSSPEESAETSPTEKPLEDVQQAEEAEGEGATSDGERRKDGVTPWASFKKLVTPKRRPKRPSESDKEDEVEKTKTSTMSSTDSGGTVEHQEEPKETNEEQKLEKSTDESKKKVDSSVSWEALICVGSSKKRARKTSDSDEEEGIKSPDEAKKTEEVVATKETESDSPITSSQEQQIQESTSPDQAGSPTEADGVSTWQSFKRLVTPRRKSRTRVEEKTDETTTVASAEQSTSEGEAGKEETWVSFKKLIPGRKKKKSDGKQEHASESGQPLTEATEDDSDEPAVVPLSEFDAAEQEKLDAQKSLKEALPTVLVEQEGSLEKSTEELIHAVTITVIEGERAITSLEERSPSWISAKVSETIEHAKETEESTKRIKTEITVEETMVLSTVSQVIAEMPNTVNEMELTSEALTALEEAIENSCAEETTEMISAVSQLGESVSTEEVTPVPEEDASAKTLEDQKKHTENILHKVAEKAKLTIDTLQLQTSQDVTNFTPSVIQASVKAKEIVCESAPLCAEEQTNLTPDALEDQDDKSTIVRAEETVQQICISVIEKTKENAITSETLQDNVNVPVINEYKTVNICTSASVSKEEPSDQPTILLSTEKSDGNISISSENQVVKATPTSNETKEVTPLKMEEKCVDTSDSVITEHVVQESSTTLEAVCAKDGLFSAEDVKKNEDMTGLTEIKESVCALAEVQDDKAVLALGAFQVTDNVPALNELQTKECGFLSAEVVSVSSELQPKEVAPPSSEEQPKEVAPPSSELQPKEVAPPSNEEPPKEVAPPSSDEQPKEVASPSSDEQPKEVAPASGDEQPKEVAPASSDEQPKEVAPASSDEQPKEVAPVSSDEQPKEVAPPSSDEQPKEVAPPSSDEQPKEFASSSSDEQPKEVAPASSDEQPKEVAPVSSDEQPKEVAPPSSDEQPKEVAPPSSDEQPKEFASSSSDEQPKEVALPSSDEQPKEVAPASSDEQPKEVAPASSDEQPKEVAPPSSDEQPKEVAPPSSDEQPKEFAPSSSDEQPKEVALPSSDEQPKEVASASSDEQPKDVAPASSDEQPKEVAPASSDEQPKEVAHASSNEQPKEVAPPSSDEQHKEVAPPSGDEQPKEVAPPSGDEQPKEVAPASGDEQPKEVAPASSDEQPKEVASASSDEQPKEVAPLSSDEQPKEVASPSSDEQHKEVAHPSGDEQPKEVAPPSGDEQPKEVAPPSDDEQPKEVAPASGDEQPKEVAPASSDEQAKEVAPASSDEQSKEVAPASSDEQLRDVAPAPSDEQPKHGEPAPSDEQLKEVAPASSDEQPKEVEPASSDEQLKDDAPAPSDEQPKHGEPAPSDEHPKEVALVPSEGETISTLGTSSNLQLEKIASVLNEVKPEECVCLSNAFQAEGVLGASNELQFKVGSVSSEVKNEEIPLSEAQKTEVIPVNMDTEDKSGILASTEMESEELKVEECLEVPVKEQAEENVTLSDHVKAERGIALLAEVQGVESVPVLVEVGSNILAEVKTEEITVLLAEVDTEKSVAVLADLQFEEQAPESAKVQLEENAPISSEVQAKDNVTVDESANLPVDVQAEENLCMSDELKTKETSSALPEVQAEDNFSVSPSVPTEEVGNRIEESSRKVEIQAEESVEVANEVKSTEVTPVLDKEIVQTNECLSVLDDTQTEISAHAATEVQTEQIAPVTVEQMGDVQSEVSNVEADKVAFSVEMQVDGKASEEHIEVATVNDVNTEENVLKVVENVQESEKDLSFTEHKESGSDNQIQKLTIEEAVAETDVSKQETVALQIENVCTISNIEFKDTLPSTAQKEAKEPEIECKEDKITSSQGKTEEKEEGEVVTENIPELESLEEIKASEPVTPAAEEEQVLVEIVKTIEMSKDSIESSEVSKDNEVLSKGLQVVVKSVSQKAAAIVDAAIEAATNSFVVVATSQGATVEETTVSAKVKVTEETNAQKIRIDSCSTTSVQNIIETTVESVVNSIHVKESISVQGPNLQIDSQVQKTLHKSMEPCPQLKESEQKMTEEVKKIGKEIELSVPEPIQCKNEHQVSTQASEVNAQEKTPTVKS
ncbi:A-kinase anchor protein 12 isoform X1 [Eleutherodactylus coqui]|uniref:A-kinase anchor protein 12 isoform X1 n=2 Tax=Eleutherodactylus coqui TaxID=57060 RepID=UPI003462848B